MSTTAILKWVHGQVDGDIRRALNVLFYEQAKPAIAVLRKKLAKHPGATRFDFEPSGFIVLS